MPHATAFIVLVSLPILDGLLKYTNLKEIRTKEHKVQTMILNDSLTLKLIHTTDSSLKRCLNLKQSVDEKKIVFYVDRTNLKTSSWTDQMVN